MVEPKLPKLRRLEAGATTRAEDFAEWYNQLVLRADYAPVRGWSRG